MVVVMGLDMGVGVVIGVGHGCAMSSGCECWLVRRRIMGVFIGMVLCWYDYGLVCSCSWNVIVSVFSYLWVCFIYLHVCHVDSESSCGNVFGDINVVNKEFSYILWRL